MKPNEEKRTKRVMVRYAPSEHAELAKIQSKTNLSLCAFIRKITLEKAPTVIDTETTNSYKEMLKLCKIISNNINQISKAYNAFAHTKVHFSQTTQQCIKDTLHIMQLWQKMEMKLTTPPGMKQ